MSGERQQWRNEILRIGEHLLGCRDCERGRPCSGRAALAVAEQRAWSDLEASRLEAGS